MSVIRRSDWLRRVDVGAARDVLLEHVVLDRAGRAGRRRRPAPRRRAGRAAAASQPGALIVIDVETLSSGSPSKSVRMSSIESMATPTLPTSPCAIGVVGVVAHLGRQVEGDRQPAGAGLRRAGGSAALDSLAVPNPAYWRIVHGRPVYIDRVDAAGVGILARLAELLVGVEARRGRRRVVHGLDRAGRTRSAHQCQPCRRAYRREGRPLPSGHRTLSISRHRGRMP